MRLDKYLQTTGIVPRRERAKQACDVGLILVDGKPAKPSNEVRVGQMIKVELGMRVTVYEVLALAERPVAREKRDEYRRIVSDERVEMEL
jgi:ribosomal 50S subunit-recycling heat shock protein